MNFFDIASLKLLYIVCDLYYFELNVMVTLPSHNMTPGFTTFSNAQKLWSPLEANEDGE